MSTSRVVIAASDDGKQARVAWNALKDIAKQRGDETVESGVEGSLVGNHGVLIKVLLSQSGRIKTLAFRRRLQHGAPQDNLEGWQNIDAARTRYLRSTCIWCGSGSTDGRH